MTERLGWGNLTVMVWKDKRNVNILNNILLLPAEGNFGGKRIGCHACSAKNKATRMKFKCPECNIGLCALPCGEGYCTKLHF